VSGKFFVRAIQALNKLGGRAPLLLIRRMKIGVVLLDQPLPGPPHCVEAGTVRKLKVSIVTDKDRIPGLIGTYRRVPSPPRAC
jgi:hypothetical protein